MILVNSSPKDALKIFQPFLPIFVPIGIGFLLAALKDVQIAARFIDEQVDDEPLDLIEEYITGMEPPYIFGFSVLTAGYSSAVKLSARLKELYPDCFIIFGGIHPTALPEDCLAHPQVDAVVRGEGERALIQLYRRVKAGEPWQDTENVSYLRDGAAVHNPVSPHFADLDALPHFPYEEFAGRKRYDFGFILSSRGCPYQCIFCSNRVTTGMKYRYLGAAAIADDLEMLNSQYGVTYVQFLDDNFLVNKRRVYELIDEIRCRGLDTLMTFNFQGRGDNVDRDLLQSMFETGFRSIFIGLETASESIMKLIKKGETVEQCKEAVRIAKDIGYHVSATFIYALPTETHEDRMDCVALCNELDINMVRYNNATPYPGTELFRMAKEDGGLHVVGDYENFNSVSTFIENPFKPIPFSYVPPGNSEGEIRRDILFSYFNFYLSWHRLVRIFTRPDLGAGWFNAGGGLGESLRKLPSLAVLGFMGLFKFLGFLFDSTLRPSTRRPLRFLGSIFRKTPTG